MELMTGQRVLRLIEDYLFVGRLRNHPFLFKNDLPADAADANAGPLATGKVRHPVGMGLTYFNEKNPQAGQNGVPADKTLLSKLTFCHGAAFGAVLRVDP